MATSPIRRLTQGAASPVQGDNNRASNSRGNPSAQTGTEQSVARGGANQPPIISPSPNASILQRQRAIALWNTTSGEVYKLPPFSPLRSQTTVPENQSTQNLPAGSPPRNSKRARLDSAAHSIPDRSIRFSRLAGTPQTSNGNSLPAQAREALIAIGIPEKAISKLELIIEKTNGNYALCGSSALAIHMRSVGLQHELKVGDLDVIYTGEVNKDMIAMKLQEQLSSPNSKANTERGQILLVVLEIEEKVRFKIDLVPKTQAFGTEFTTINGLPVASLASLETSYELTKDDPHGAKSSAAESKLKIIKELKSNPMYATSKA